MRGFSKSDHGHAGQHLLHQRSRDTSTNLKAGQDCCKQSSYAVRGKLCT